MIQVYLAVLTPLLDVKAGIEGNADVLIDTHAHLDFDDFDDDRDEVLERAVKAGIDAVIIPGIDVASSRKAVELAERYGMLYAAVGIHPNSVNAAEPGDNVRIARLAEESGVCAIGEIGLDFYRDRTPREEQVRAFRGQLSLAHELDLPVIVHFREVGQDGVDMTGREHLESVRGVFHCYGGSVDFAETVLNMGYYIGFDGPLTYPKSDRVDVARTVPLDRIVVETDAPFLAPQAMRGKRNESSYVTEVARALAEIKHVDVGEVEEVTTRNAHRLFGIT